MKMSSVKHHNYLLLLIHFCEIKHAIRSKFTMKAWISISYLASRSIFPDCSRTSQTQATCSWVKPNEAIPVVGVELAEDVPTRDEDSAPPIVLLWEADAAAATAAAEYSPSAAALKLAGDTATAEAAAALPY